MNNELNSSSLETPNEPISQVLQLETISNNVIGTATVSSNYEETPSQVVSQDMEFLFSNEVQFPCLNSNIPSCTLGNDIVNAPELTEVHAVGTSISGDVRNWQDVQCDSEKASPKDEPPKRSSVWKHYKRLDTEPDKVKCRRCKSSIITKHTNYSPTTILLKHLKSETCTGKLRQMKKAIKDASKSKVNERGQRSKVWLYFKANANGNPHLARCLQCEAVLKYRTSNNKNYTTSCLLKHLRRKHNILTLPVKDDILESPLSDADSLSDERKLDGQNSLDVTEKLNVNDTLVSDGEEKSQPRKMNRVKKLIKTRNAGLNLKRKKQLELKELTVKAGPPAQKSWVWKHYDVVSEGKKRLVRCLQCKKMFIHSSTTGNLIRHLTHIHQVFASSDDDRHSMSSDPESGNVSDADDRYRPDNLNENELKKFAWVWQFFRVLTNESDIRKFKCEKCKRILPHWSKTTDLCRHLNQKHQIYAEYVQDEKENVEISQMSVNPFNSLVGSQRQEDVQLVPTMDVGDRDCSGDVPKATQLKHTPSQMARHPKLSAVWKYFVLVEDNFAQCNLCNGRIAYRPGLSTTNLKRHVVKKHPEHKLTGIHFKKEQENSANRSRSCSPAFVNNEQISTQMFKSSPRRLSSSSADNSVNIFSFETIAVTTPAKNVFKVELSRANKMNAISRKMLTEMKNCFDELSTHPECRVIVLSAAGKIFCAGVDLQEMMSLAPRLADCNDISQKSKILLGYIRDFQESINSLEKCSKPVIAAVHSACIGGGVDLLTATDIRMCSQNAWFQVKEVDIGMAADVGTLQRLPKVIGSQSLVRDLCLTARKMEADEAFKCGLVSEVHEDGNSLQEAALNKAKLIASKSPVAVQGTKQSLIYSRDHTVDEGLNHIALWNASMLQSEDFLTAAMNQFAKSEDPIEFPDL